MKSLLLPLLASIALPTAAQAEINDEIHKRCLDARDYSGCVRANQSSSLKLKKEITGIGVNLFLNTETSEITIQSIINGTPASNADIESGDVILEVDGKSTKGVGIEEAIELIKGPKDKLVKLVLGRTNEKGKKLKFAWLEVLLKFQITNGV